MTNELILLEARNIFDKCDRVYNKDIALVTNKLYKFLPDNESNFKDLCELFMSQNSYGYYSVATNWFKKRNTVIKKENIEYFEHLLYNYAHNWGRVDQLCYRAINPVIELDSKFYDYLVKWSNSENKNVRRASLVAMIQSRGSHSTEYDYNKLIFIVNKLINDQDLHVKKGIGWLLKVAYLKYPLKIEKYLRENVKQLDRVIFRYALDHIKNPLREELLNLEYK